MKDSILRILLVFSIFIIILISGCITEKPETITKIRYVCYDGSIVSDSRDCPREEVEKIFIDRYVCWNGDIVNNSEECPILITTTLATTTTSISTSSTTTTTTGISTIPTTTISTTTTIDYCRELGCPPGTKFVASSKSTKYHYCDCKWARKINPENLVCYDSVEEAQDDGKEPCRVCKPPS